MYITLFEVFSSLLRICPSSFLSSTLDCSWLLVPDLVNNFFVTGLLLLVNRRLHLKKYLERCSIFKTRYYCTLLSLNKKNWLFFNLSRNMIPVLLMSDYSSRSQALIGFPSQNQKLRSLSRMKPRVMVINRIPVTHPPRTIPPKKTKQKMNWRELIPRPMMSYDHYLYDIRNQRALQNRIYG